VTGRARELDAADPAAGYRTSGGGYGRMPNGLPFVPSGQLWGWAPGRVPQWSPPGTAGALPAGADVLLQVHYHKRAKPEADATSIGLYFARGPVDKQIRGAVVLPPRAGLFAKPELRIPAGDPRYPVKGSFTVGYDVHLIAVFPHMHYLGKDFLLRAIRPDGSRQTLIRIDNWDFNWQNPYEVVAPVALARGTSLGMEGRFDYSAGDPRHSGHPAVGGGLGGPLNGGMGFRLPPPPRRDGNPKKRPPDPPK